MSAPQLGFRIQCAEARVNLQRLREGRLSKEEKKFLFYTTQQMRDARFYIDDQPSITPPRDAGARPAAQAGAEGARRDLRRLPPDHGLAAEVREPDAGGRRLLARPEGPRQGARRPRHRARRSSRGARSSAARRRSRSSRTSASRAPSSRTPTSSSSSRGPSTTTRTRPTRTSARSSSPSRGTARRDASRSAGRARRPASPTSPRCPKAPECDGRIAPGIIGGGEPP